MFVGTPADGIPATFSWWQGILCASVNSSEAGGKSLLSTVNRQTPPALRLEGVPEQDQVEHNDNAGNGPEQDFAARRVGVGAHDLAG